MMADRDRTKQQRQTRRRAFLCRAILAPGIVIAALIGAGAAAAMPLAGPPDIGRISAIVRVQTSCDARGCFTYGPRQSYQRPAYRPLGQTGQRFYSPRAAGPPRFIYRPQAPTPLPQARLPAADPSFHRQSCMNRYRSYDPVTDSYIGSGRKSVRCVLPARR